MRPLMSFTALLGIKVVSRLFYRLEMSWVEGREPEDPWNDVRLLCLLNHTSLFEPLFAGVAPNRFLWEIAHRAVVPAADKTMRRPIVGRFIGMLVRHPVSITREPDHTWEAVLSRIEERSMVIILPEGRMRRATGLDSEGQPMSARGGIADILHVLQSGKMLIGYSGGLHHVQVPGQTLPRAFKTLRIRFEQLDIARYRGRLLVEHGEQGFKRALKADLDRRRDLYAPWTAETTARDPTRGAVRRGTTPLHERAGHPVQDR
ncbi:MAG: hypothetical protein R2991_06450 [Thermoanaerobaculia bacterium]